MATEVTKMKRFLLGAGGRLSGYWRDLYWACSPNPKWPINPGPLPPVIDDLLKHWREHGWVLLKNSVVDEAIERLGREVVEFRSKQRGGVDEQGYGMRIGLLHVVNRSSLHVAMNPQVLDFLGVIWPERKPILFGSLTFDIGTEQEPHIDAAFFYTRPEDAMVGVWTALEDVDNDAGPLFYIDRSHRMPRLYSCEVLEAEPELAQRVEAFRRRGGKPDEALSEEVYQAYSRMLQRRLDELDLVKVPAVIEKGDVFIWDGWIVHGGMPRSNRALTRKSMVAHFMRDDARFWDQHEFFLRGNDLQEDKAKKFRLRRYHGTPWVKYDGAVTFDSGDGHFDA